VQSRISIIIAGPTAVGKTDVACRVAKKFGCEIISADARQIYRGMVIGTAAPLNPPIRHHLVGILNPSDRCTAAWWAQRAAEVMEGIREREKMALVVGGTGLYIRALVEGIFPGPGEDMEFRAELQKRADAGENLHAELEIVDPIAAEQIHPNNLVRIIRALEVYHITGEPLSKQFAQTIPIAENWQFLKFFLTRPREELYRRINGRTHHMLQNGWIEETKRLLDSGVSVSSPGMEAIGYKEIVRYFRGELDKRELYEIISQKTRNYAKRQLTWFRHRPGYEEMNVKELGVEEVANRIIASYNELKRVCG